MSRDLFVLSYLRALKRALSTLAVAINRKVTIAAGEGPANARRIAPHLAPT
jgi:hypothetical protein